MVSAKSKGTDDWSRFVTRRELNLIFASYHREWHTSLWKRLLRRLGVLS